MSLTSLVIPIFFENLVRTSLMAVDQLMLYAYSEKAAAAMSTVNQLSFFIQLLYSMVAIGTGISISQNVGAGKKAEAGLISSAGFVLVTLFSLFLSISVVFAAPFVLSRFSLEAIVFKHALTYLTIFGAGSIFMAMNIVQAAILRSHGFARDPMYVNIFVLALNIFGNSIALFGLFGLPVFGVAGVAVSTVFSQLVAFFLLAYRIRSKGSDIEFSLKNIFRIPPWAYRSILAVGVPTAGENLSYNIAQIMIVSFIARMGTSSLAAYGLVITLSRYVFISGVSIGQATQIKVGFLVGARRSEEAQRCVYRYFLLGIVISVLAVLLLYFFRSSLIGLFTDDPRITAIAASALLVSLLLEPGRSFNTIITPALKGSGDIRFPVYVGLVFMWLFGVLFAYVFGIVLGLGLVGVWLALSMDEWTRGLIHLFRWKSGAWKAKSLVS